MCFRVSDEKEARGYLQALANKMREELDSLKVTGVTAVSIPRDHPRDHSTRLA